MAYTLDTNALVPLADLKEYLGDPTGKDNILTGIINYQTLFIEGYCRRNFKSRTYTDEIIDGDLNKQRWKLILKLRYYPVSSITTLKYESTGTVINSADYFLYPDLGIVEVERGPDLVRAIESILNDEPNRIKATYIAGFSTIPSDLYFACLQLCAIEYNRSYPGKQLVGVVAEGLPGGGSITHIQGVPENIQLTLDKYSKIR